MIGCDTIRRHFPHFTGQLTTREWVRAIWLAHTPTPGRPAPAPMRDARDADTSAYEDWIASGRKHTERKRP